MEYHSLCMLKQKDLKIQANTATQIINMTKQGNLYEGRYHIYQFIPKSAFANYKDAITKCAPLFFLLISDQWITKWCFWHVQFQFKLQIKQESGRIIWINGSKDTVNSTMQLDEKLPLNLIQLISLNHGQNIIKIELHTKIYNPCTRCMFELPNHEAGEDGHIILKGEYDSDLKVEDEDD